MMNISTPARTRITISSALMGALLALGGCGVLGDSDLKAQQKAQTDLEQIASKYTTVVAKVGTQNDPLQSATKIDGLIREVNSLTGTSEQQKQIGSTLTAAMSASAGAMRAQVLGAMSIEQAMLREHIAETASAAMIVAAGAEPRATADFSDAHDRIAQDRAAADARRQAIEREIAAMQQPLAQMKQQRDRSSQQLGQLQSDAAQLRQRANDAGPVDGYPLVEEAAGVHSRTIPVKTALAEAEIQLSNLEPDIERLESTRDNENAIQEATQRAEENTKRLHDAVVAAGEVGRERASTLVAELEKQIETYEARNTSEMKPIFEKAVANLEKAQRGARGSKGTGVVIAGNSARILGDLHAMRADAAAANAQLYGALAMTGELTGSDAQKWSERAAKAAEAKTQAIEAARAAYEAALEKLGQGRDNQAAREAVQNLLAALDGTSIVPSAPLELAAPNRTGRTRPGGRRPGAGGESLGNMGALMGTKGFSSPQAVADFMNGLRNAQPTPAMMRKMAAATYTTDPIIIESMNSPQATRQQMAMLSGGGAGPEFIVESETGNTADLGFKNPPPNMPAIGIPLIKRNGEWFLDADALSKRMEQLFNNAFEQFEQGVSAPSGGGRGSGRGGR